MSEQNKALARRFYEEVFNKQNVDFVDDACTSDFVDHTAMPGQGPGREGLKESFGSFKTAFPDMHAEIEDMVADGDVVVARFTGTATHKGELMGAPATNRRITFHGIDWLKFKDGKVAEVWHQGDDMMVMASLGVKMPG
jgi:steroid delta-isomerase-like uncharacterized protein